MKTQLFTLITLALLFLQASCEKENDGGTPIDLSEKSEKIVKADNAFGLEIFKTIYANETEENLMISPLSISIALSMAYNGAATETKAEMQNVLQKNDFTNEEINSTYKKLIEALTNSDPKVAMEIANSIWYRDGYNVEQSFLDINSLYYQAEVEKADFNNTNTVDLINKWVSDNTHKKIPTIIDEITPATVMYIINAIYFNGSWTQEFNPENTRENPFSISNQNYIQVEMMQRLDTLNYFSNDLFSSVQLDYGKGNFCMQIFLPNYEFTVADVVEELNAENWEQWQKNFSITNDVDVLLPKFKIEYKNSLKTVLQEIGMKEAFKSSADFSGINKNRDLFISEVLHKTFIEVDEEGTEAAAVTAIVFEKTSIDPNAPQKVYFHCNRPFLFAISEKETGAILFMGKVGNPSNLN